MPVGRSDAGTSGTGRWLDEIDLDPSTPWLRMGTTALGNEPWLVVDERRDEELALKRHLYETDPGSVYAALDGTAGAAAEVLGLVLVAVGGEPEPGRPPLADAGLRVQEDLCVVRRRADTWCLDAASLSFPSRWRLAEKLGRPLAAVHGPVPGYPTVLARRVDQLLDRLGPRPVRRRNWFVHPDGALHQPAPPPGGDPVVPRARCADDLFVRSERQTLRRLPASGAVLFTIRVQQAPLATLLADAARAEAFRRYLHEADPADLAHRGLAPAQVAELRGL